VDLSEAGQKQLETALRLAERVLAGDLPKPEADPAYEGTHSIRQVQRRLSPEEIESLVGDYRAGASTYQLAARWKIHRATVSNHLRRAGERVRTQGEVEVEMDEARQLRVEGWSFNRLARKYGIDPKTMKKRLTGTIGSSAERQ